MEEDEHIADRDDDERDADAADDDEERVLVAGGAVPQARQGFRVVPMPTPARDVGQLEEETENPDAHAHEPRLGRGEDARVALVVDDGNVPVKVNIPKE